MRRRAPRSAIVVISAVTSTVLAGCGVEPGVSAERSVEIRTAPPTTPGTDPAIPDPTDPARPPTTTPSEPTTPPADQPATDTVPPAPDAPTLLQPVDIADVTNVGDAKTDRPYDDLVAAALADIELWWGDVFPVIYGAPFEPLEGGVYPAYPGRQDIPGCGTPSTEYRDVAEFAAFYCALGDFMVYDDGDDSLLGELAAQFGPSIMGVVLAHEYAHAIQFRTGDLDRPLPTIFTEQQADCLAGAWVGRATRGESPILRLTDSDVRGGLIAMVTVRDPVGTDQFLEGGHGSAFDRIGAFQEGYALGPGRCAELLDDPLPLMPNEFQSVADELNEGDLPFGYEEGAIAPLIVDALGSYWTFQLGEFGVTFEQLTLVPLQRDDSLDCPTSPSFAGPGVTVCDENGTVFLDDETARLLYDDPIEGRADFAVGYLIAVGWADVAQTRLGSDLVGEPRALANDCLVGAWTRDLDPGRELRPDETPEERGEISPGDLDEAVLAAITIGDPGFDDDRIGSAFEKIGSFRVGVLQGIEACREQLAG